MMESSCTDDVNVLLGMMTEHADDPSVQATAAGALARRFDEIWPRGCKDAAMPDEVCGCGCFLTFEVRDKLRFDGMCIWVAMVLRTGPTATQCYGCDSLGRRLGPISPKRCRPRELHLGLEHFGSHRTQWCACV